MLANRRAWMVAALVAAMGAGCGRAPSPKAAAPPPRAAVAVSAPKPAPILTPVVAAPPAFPSEAAWTSYFQAIADAGRPCDQLVQTVVKASRGDDRGALYGAALAAQGACSSAAAAQSTARPPQPLSSEARASLLAASATMAKGYLGKSFGMRTVADNARAGLKPIAEVDIQAVLGMADGDIFSGRGAMVAVAHQNGWSEGKPAAPETHSAGEPAPTERMTAAPARLTKAVLHRAAPMRRPHRRRVILADCGGRGCSKPSASHAQRTHAPAYRWAEESECRRFTVLPCRTIDRRAVTASADE